MIASVKSWLALACLFSAPVMLVTPGAAQQPRVAVSFCGTFQWEGAAEKATVQLDFPVRRQQPDGNWSLDGSGWTTITRPGETVALRFSALFDPRNRRIEITESVAPEIMNWDSDGSYVGTVNERGDAFVAVWTSRKPPHATGRLVVGPCQAPSS